MRARSLLRCAAVLLALLLFSPLVFAQPNRPGQPGRFPNPPNRPVQPVPSSDADAAAGAAGCAACGGFVVVFAIVGAISIIAMAIWAVVAVWVARDARARGMDNSAMYVVLVLFLGVIGLIIYIVSRPQGDLQECHECGKKRLGELKRCPHCRAA